MNARRVRTTAYAVFEGTMVAPDIDNLRWRDVVIAKLQPPQPPFQLSGGFSECKGNRWIVK